ncbi:MAG: hypothetical protein WCO92_03660 [Verrucomicrobiota bacterium]
MKKILFLLCAANIQAQNLYQSTDDRLQTSIDQNSSPLMMFGGEEKKTPARDEQRHPRQASEQAETKDSDTGNSSLVARGPSARASEEKESYDERSPLAHQQALTLQHFRDALEAYPEAERFIIVANGDNPIQPEIPLATTTVARSNNLAIINALRDAVQREYSLISEDIVNEVRGGPQNSVR